MTQITVYHHLLANDKSIEKPIVYPVAFFQDASIDEIFEATNSIHDAWVASRDEGIMIMLRSTSVGDLVKVATNDGNKEIWFVVAGMGFEAADPNDYIITMTMTADSAEAAREIPGRFERIWKYSR